ncbi:FIST signal transduction protein [Nitrospira sp. M1]
MEIHTFSLHSGRQHEVPVSAMHDPEKTLILMFGASNIPDASAMIHAVCQAYPGATVMGCSTVGEILGTHIHDDSFTVAVVEFARTSVRMASVEIHDSLDSYGAGKTLSEALRTPDLRGVFVLSDGLLVNGSELVQGLNATLPESVVVTGGLAGDGKRFQQTWVIHEGQPKSGHVTAVGLYGDAVRIGHGSKGGWEMLGLERRVTRSERNVLFELDGKPALELYKKYLGDRADELPASCLFFPLAFRPDGSKDVQLVRTILQIDEAKQSMTFAGDIPQGAIAQFMRASFDRLVEGASQAATLTVHEQHPDQPTLAIAISCVGRRLLLGERTEEEVEATLDVFPSGTTQIGFYSYGELSPYTNGRCDLHNQTMTLTTITEL